MIKSNRYISLEEIRKLEAFIYQPPAPEAESESFDPEQAYASERRKQSEAVAEQLIEDAKTAAEELLQGASDEANRLMNEANSQIERWWDERRMEDLRVVEESRQSGYETGYREGLRQAEDETAEKYESLLREARQLVEEAHHVKERVISEAEPFLVELATAVAKKIIGEHLAVDTEWTKAQVKRTLERRREKGLITLCVAPSQFAKMQDARAELLLAVDSEADLTIVPDATVDEGGCVVRTSFGSIDARIDTQLSELKAALMEVASESDEGAGAP
ncbi:flagellar assembly protein FliH [Paenibacillus sp.]|uniref:flagellar assembly protein FliH n=1 Tax=Paenibacillus sp. TaxID=58172 RepID=UPI0028110529|nr:flagellar assembly protein FliH [Paenibacillus sp.]